MAGIEVPTLCHAPGLRPQTSCMICVVEESNTGRTLPACSAKAEEGMVVQTNTPSIRAARLEILQLLLSEHAGDCEAPCRRMCPASMNIPLMLRSIAQGDTHTAARIAASALVLPATLGWVCNAPCQVGCRRAVHDEAIAIRDLHRQVAEEALEQHAPPLPCAPDSGKQAAVIGAGPAGLAAAWVLRRYGHACTVYEKAAQAGGSLRALPEERLPHAILDAEIDILRQMGVVFLYGCEVGLARPLKDVLGQNDAVIVACNELASKEDPLFLAKEERMTIRAVAAGKKAAEEAHRAIAPKGAGAIDKPYDSSLGRLNADQVAHYAIHRVDPAVLSRPSQPEHPREEAERCLHCDCHAPRSCKLRRYATQYGAKPRAFRAAERAPIQAIHRHGDILFDPGKCIKCGLCVEICRTQKEALGLTFVGRGFNTQVKAPFNESLEAALMQCARACVDACPTGALVFSTQEEHKP